MGHQRAYRAAVAGKRRGSKARPGVGHLSGVTTASLRGRNIAGGLRVQLASYAQSARLRGHGRLLVGRGTVTLDDGSTERIRCRASYAVGASGAGLNQTLTCASDSYKFDFKTNVMSEQGSLSGTWSESSRGISGSLQDVAATAISRSSPPPPDSPPTSR